MAEEDLLRIIGWLDPAKKPLILMGYEESLRKLDYCTGGAHVAPPPA